MHTIVLAFVWRLPLFLPSFSGGERNPPFWRRQQIIQHTYSKTYHGPCRKTDFRVLKKASPQYYTMLSQRPERPYTRRKIVIFKSAKLQICANFGAIGAIAQDISVRKEGAYVDACVEFARLFNLRSKPFLSSLRNFRAIASTHAPKLRENCAKIAPLCLYNGFASFVHLEDRVAEWLQ